MGSFIRIPHVLLFTGQLGLGVQARAAHVESQGELAAAPDGGTRA